MQPELLRPKKERAWGWPAVANFVLAGSGAGLYLLVSVGAFAGIESLSGVLAGPTGILPVALVCLGFLAISREAGRPLRAFYLLSNLRSSWMSIEVFAGTLFISSAAVHWFLPVELLHSAAVLAALGLIVSHGFILYRARAMAAWNRPVIPILFFSSALTLGGGVLLITGGLLQVHLYRGVFMIVLVSLLSDLAVWAFYAGKKQDRDVTRAMDFLRRPLTVSLVIGLGHILPSCLLIALIMTADMSVIAGIRNTVIALTGLCILIGGASQKIVIVLGANFIRGISIYGRDGTAPVVNPEAASVRSGHPREGRKVSADSEKSNVLPPANN